MPTSFLIQHPPSAPVIACIELTLSRTGATYFAPFVTRVLPPNANRSVAAAVGEFGLCP